MRSDSKLLKQARESGVRGAGHLGAGSRSHPPKTDDKKYLKLLKKAAKVFDETLDMKKAAKVLNIAPSTFRAYCSDKGTNESIRKILSPVYKKYKKHLKSLPPKESVDPNAVKRREYKKHLSNGGFNAKDYMAHLYHACQDKASVALEISLLNSTISNAVEKKLPEIEIEILRRKVFLAKAYFKKMAHLR